MNRNFEPYILAREYGWPHSEIMNLTRAEALYYLIAPAAYERYLKRRGGGRRAGGYAQRGGG